MMTPVVSAMCTGFVLGGSSGISPGPLSLIAIAHTLHGGLRRGMLAACAPLVTDLPIIAFSLFVFNHLADSRWILSFISFAGAGFLCFLSYQSFRFEGDRPATGTLAAGNPLYQGVMTNLLNPYPYLFWITVGAPYASRLVLQHDFGAVAFFASFYSGFVLSKLVIAGAALRGQALLTATGYRYTMKSIGAVMLFFGVMFALRGWSYLAGGG